MKPLALCLNFLSEKGVKNIRCYPLNLTNRQLKNVVAKSMNEDSKDGEFLFSAVGSKIVASYVFHVPIQSATAKASLTYVFNNINFNPQEINVYFERTVNKLKENNMLDFETIANVLPKLFSDFRKSTDIKIKVKSAVSIEIKSEKKKKRVPRKDIIEKIGDDLWD